MRDDPRVVVQIPCRDEVATIAAVIEAVPRGWTARGEREISDVTILVLDDGSTDGSAEAARAAGAEVVTPGRAVGLARIFRFGLDEALARDADIVVNLDADGQYDPAEIPALVQPLLDGKAELVLGARPVATTPHFSWLKRRLQVAGSRLVELCSGLKVSDATTGFRALGREAALRLNVHTDFTYTLETLIQAGQAGLRVAEVRARQRPVARPSRLASSAPVYLWRSLCTAPRMVLLYRPLASFACAGALVAAPGVLLGLRYLYLMAEGEGRGHVQSLILCAILLLAGFQLLLAGLIGDVIAGNRRLGEESLRRLRDLDSRRAPANAEATPASVLQE